MAKIKILTKANKFEIAYKVQEVFLGKKDSYEFQIDNWVVTSGAYGPKKLINGAVQVIVYNDRNATWASIRSKDDIGETVPVTGLTLSEARGVHFLALDCQKFREDGFYSFHFRMN